MEEELLNEAIERCMEESVSIEDLFEVLNLAQSVIA